MRRLAFALILVVILSMCLSCGGAGTLAPFSPVSTVPSSSPGSVVARSLSVTPTSLLSKVGDSWPLSAAVQGVGSTALIWSVAEGAAGGSISSAGVYTAPPTTGTYHLVVASAEDKSLTATVPVTVVAHGFTVVGAIPVRMNSTATLLPGGDVILLGGLKGWESSEDAFCPDVYVREFTRFRAATATFTQGAATLDFRAGHTATLLPDGRILVAGGAMNRGCSSTMINSAEILDPATGVFTATGMLGNNRSHFSATALPNGNVLVAGGFASVGTEQAGAELYDPATARFLPAASMNIGRAMHRAVSLGNGKVLLFGGYISRPPNMEASVELYDSATGNFSVIGSISARAEYTTTLLADGTVLIAGGSDGKGNVADTIERFDPATATVTLAGRMLTPREGHTATVLASGLVLMVGGDNYLQQPTWSYPVASAELYDPRTQTSSPVAPLHFARAGHNATLLLNGRVLITDGAVGWAEMYE